MGRIFKDAKDYKSQSRKISKEKRALIEKKLGSELLPGQRDFFQYYEMTGKDGKNIGHIIACSQKGQYGAVEVVFGLDDKHKINGIYVQRSRERDRSFKKRNFLDRFIGKSVNEARDFPKLHKGKKTPGTEAVIRGLMKELITFKEIVLD